MILDFLKTLLGGSSAIKDVAEVFVPNAEKSEERAAQEQQAVMKAYQAEFTAKQNRTLFDSFVDGLNRMIRPIIALSILGIFFLTYFSPTEVVKISQSLAVLPPGYWGLLSVIIAFYFGGRMQLKAHDFQFKQSQVAAAAQLVQKRKEFRDMGYEDDEPDRLTGDKVSKSGEVEHHIAQHNNSVVARFNQLHADEPDKLDSELEKSKKKESEELQNFMWDDETSDM